MKKTNDDEEILAVVEPTTDPFEGKEGFTLGRNLCSNCKKSIHNTPAKKIGGEKKVRCKSLDCECKCRTHYVGSNGHLVPYGMEDPSLSEIDTQSLPRNQQDDFIDNLNLEFKKQHKIVNTIKVDASGKINS